jgi:hypothetical protein
MHVSKVSISNIGLLLMSGPFCVQNPALCVNELCNTETLAGQAMPAFFPIVRHSQIER